MVEAAAQAIGGEEKCECGGFHTLSLYLCCLRWKIDMIEERISVSLGGWWCFDN